MSRLFDGTDDVMTFNLGASGGVAGYAFGTLLVVARFVSTPSWASLIELERSNGEARGGISRRGTAGDLLTYNHSASVGSSEAGTGTSFTIGTGDNWCLYVVTKATGTAAPTFTKVPLATGTRTTIQTTNTLANSSTLASGFIRLGGNDDFANIRLAVAAVLPGIVLNTTQIDGIASAKTTASILALVDGSSWVADDSDAFATDLNGNHDRSAIVGTADDADDPSGWVYGAGGGGTTDHEHDQDDTASATDAVSKAAKPAKADTATATDALSKAPGKRPADTASVTDAQAKTAGKRPADTASVTDAQAKTLTKALADTASVTDTGLAQEADYTHQIDDTLSIDDSFDTGGDQAFEQDVNDTASVTDAQAKALAKAIADTIAGTDAQAKAAAKTAADTIAVTDSTSAAGDLAHTHEIDDTITGTDALTREWEAHLELADTPSVTDSVDTNWSGELRAWTYDRDTSWTYEPVTG